MRARSKAISWRRVVVDICTQRDFLQPGAILQVANLQPLLANLKSFFAWVRASGLPVFSAVESHRPSEPAVGFPLHCIDGTPGQGKLDFTLLNPHCLVEADNSLALPPDLLKKYRQLIFRKRARDVLSNPKADRFLTQLEADEFIIAGVGLERAIRGLALGLLVRHKTVTVVWDACGFWSHADADLTLRQLAAKNIRLATTEEITAAVEPASPRRRRPRPADDRHRPDQPESPDRLHPRTASA